MLLDAHARTEAADHSGYTACHVAAQYGHAAFLFHLGARRGALLEAQDADGRTPLHWASYKGFASCVRLLVFVGCDPTRGDREGCTPLHWAALRGQVRLLCCRRDGTVEEVWLFPLN